MDYIFSLYAMVQKYLLKHTKLYVAFVDFKKAFDSVNRNALWSVLRKNGVNGKLYMALRGIYNSFFFFFFFFFFFCGTVVLFFFFFFFYSLQLYCQMSIHFHYECFMVPNTLITHSHQS